LIAIQVSVELGYSVRLAHWLVLLALGCEDYFFLFCCAARQHLLGALGAHCRCVEVGRHVGAHFLEALHRSQRVGPRRLVGLVDCLEVRRQCVAVFGVGFVLRVLVDEAAQHVQVAVLQIDGAVL